MDSSRSRFQEMQQPYHFTTDKCAGATKRRFCFDRFSEKHDGGDRKTEGVGIALNNVQRRDFVALLDLRQICRRDLQSLRDLLLLQIVIYTYQPERFS